MMRNKRQDKLLALLIDKQDWMTSKQLAAILGVSDRTIRSDIDLLNKENDEPVIMSNPRQGYRFCSEKRKEITMSPASDIPQTPGARCIYIIQKLLFDIKELNLTMLQSQIYVSGYSIENDLKRIRKMLTPYTGLKLVRNKQCISLVGDEISKRRFYKDLLVAEVQENFLNLNQLAGLYKKFDLIEIKDIFEEVIGEYEYSIQESLFPMLILHAGTGIERMMHANYIGIEDSGHNLEDTIEFEISKAFFDRVSKHLGVAVKKGEIEMFALVVMGRQSASYTSDYVSFHGKWLNTKKLVMDALTRIHELFGLNFREDEDLVAGLKMHLHALIEREKNNIRLENLMLDEIKRKYPLVFEMGICVSEFLAAELGAGILESESGYLALHLGAASERMNSRRRYRVVALLPYNQSFSEMCVKKISEMFRERIEIVKVLHLFEEKTVAALEPDVLLSSLPITHNLDIMTVPINLFMDSETEANILKAINRLDKQGFQLEFTTHISSLIRKEFYFEDVDLKKPEEVIEFLCDKLHEGGIVGSDFIDIVLKREEMSPTSFVNAFAIPHAFGASALNSTIAIAQLKNPIKWGAFEIRLVMLLAINEEDHRIIKMFFDWISTVVGSPQELARICIPYGYEQFIEVITD